MLEISLLLGFFPVIVIFKEPDQRVFFFRYYCSFSFVGAFEILAIQMDRIDKWLLLLNGDCDSSGMLKPSFEESEVILILGSVYKDDNP